MAVVNDDLAALNAASLEEIDMLYTEPPVYPRPVLESIGRVAMRLGKPGEADAAYRKLLVREPGSGRALLGLANALKASGKVQEAERVLAEFDKAWATADSEYKRQ